MKSNRFDRKAVDWDKKRSRRELAKDVVAALKKLNLQPEMRAMDFGCGTGLVGIPIAHLIGTLYCVDTSAGMLDMVIKKAAEEKLTNIITCHSEIENLSLSEKLDLIFTSMTLHHIGDTDSVLQCFSSLLNPGGMVAIADLDSEDGSFHKAGSEERHHGFERTTLADSLVKHGFSKPSFSTVHTLTRSYEDNSTKDFTVFLGVAQKQQ